MNTSAPLQSQQLLRSAKLVVGLGLGLGVLMLLTGGLGFAPQSEESTTFMGVGGVVCLVSFLRR